MTEYSPYQGRDNNGNPKQDYLDKIAVMDDAELFNKTKDMIWLSAFANNNPRSDYHWQCDACYDEWRRRDKLDQYQKAWEYASSK